MKLAIIGTGITGCAAAWLLHEHHDITVYEQSRRIGGHSNTVQVDGHPPIDTGFIVYNEWTYPNLIALFDRLGVETQPTDMSFGVSMNGGKLEYAGHALFAQKTNILKPSYIRMLKDIKRFYKEAPNYLDSKEPNLSLGDYLDEHQYSDTFIRDHILPMAAAIWSMSADDVRQFPACSFIRFFKNHGLLLLKNRPQWRTVTGGSREYVEKLIAPFKDKIRQDCAAITIYRRENGVEITDKSGNTEAYDQVILACHSDQALSLLADASASERQVLSAFPYTANRAFLHQDKSFMPRRKSAWASWNYLTSTENGKVTLTYWMNSLQSFIGKDQDYFVTLNPEQEPKNVLQEISYTHPQYTMSALEGWEQIKTIQGKNKTWFCGAWCGYGFHEDGLSSALSVAEQIGPAKRPWGGRDKSPAGKNCLSD